MGTFLKKMAKLEDLVKVKEIQLKISPTEGNRCELNKTEAELGKYLNIEEEYWRQKARIKWFKDGDRNTKFFHAFVKRRRKKLHIGEIQTAQGEVVTTEEQTGAATKEFYESLFKETDVMMHPEMLDNIPCLIIQEHNDEISRVPTSEEVKIVVNELNGDRTSGQDGFSGTFLEELGDYRR